MAEDNQFGYYRDIKLQDGALVVSVEGGGGGSGTSGTSGLNGTSGINGQTGTSGVNGSSGTSGSIGQTGTSGTNGTSGIGSSGTSGTSGGGGGTLSYSALTRTTQDGALRTGDPSQGMLMGGGLMIDYANANYAIGNNTCIINTIILEPGQTLDDLVVMIAGYTVTGIVKIGLFTNIKSLNSGGREVFGPGVLVHTITSGLSITSNGDFFITNTNYTASADITQNNIYWVALWKDGGTFSTKNSTNNNLLSHIMGGNVAGSILYRSYPHYITTGSNNILSDLSSYTVSPQTSPGWQFFYSKK